MPRKNNDHVSHYSEETNVETNAGLVMRIYRIVPHIHSAVFSTLYMCKKSAIEIFLAVQVNQELFIRMFSSFISLTFQSFFHIMGFYFVFFMFFEVLFLDRFARTREIIK